MRNPLSAALAGLAVCVLFTNLCHAAQPLNTDDAGTLDPGNCQLENEYRSFRSRGELDTVAACNFLLDMEFGLGKLRVSPRDAPHTENLAYQFKKVHSLADAPDWALGISGALIRAASGNTGARQNQFSLLLSRQTGASALHLNLGTVHDLESRAGLRRDRRTWGAAAEHDFTSRWTIAGEVFGQQELPNGAQIALRWWALPKHVQFTTSGGTLRAHANQGRWLSVGIRFETGTPLF